MKKMYRLTKGFTLIELLVVVSIIGILTTLIFANLNAARERARDAQRKSDLANIRTALRLYYNDNNSYPSSIEFGSEWVDGGTQYMVNVPNDPLGDLQPYVYTPDSVNDSFYLKACLENKSDNKGIAASGITCSSGIMYQITP